MSINSFRRRLLALVLCQILVIPSAMSQQPTQPGLKIVIVRGSGAVNVVQQIAPKPLAVRVEDTNNRPVAGATVIFTAPEGGASGEFANDSATIRLTTGDDGMASVQGFHPNDIPGDYQIQVRAEFQGRTINASISQVNVAAKKSHKKLIFILAIAVAAAGAVVAAHASKSSSTGTAPTITFGTGSIGAPK